MIRGSQSGRLMSFITFLFPTLIEGSIAGATCLLLRCHQGYDLSPESSFARYMSGQGFDTWILGVRGAGLSTFRVELGPDKQHLDSMSDINSALKQGINFGFPTWQFAANNHGAYSESKINYINEEKLVKVFKF